MSEADRAAYDTEAAKVRAYYESEEWLRSNWETQEEDESFQAFLQLLQAGDAESIAKMGIE